jgi:GNAT superfamily N-acetyltransferase
VKTIVTKTTYLEMLSPPAERPPAVRDDLTIERVSRPTVEAYRQIYSAVGGQLNWVDRLRMPADELLAIITHERVEIYLLEVAGQRAGFAELDRREGDQIELAYFGLYPEFIGQGLGKYFLEWTIERAWSHQPQRLWVHTCDLDHRAALPNYVKSGFMPYREEMVEQVVDS